MKKELNWLKVNLIKIKKIKSKFNKELKRIKNED